jgi:ABC-type uncharacterized transport system permease subunit
VGSVWFVLLIPVAFGLSMVMITQWISASAISGMSIERVPLAEPLSLAYGDVIGTIMLNYAVVTIVPSWINIKVRLF